MTRLLQLAAAFLLTTTLAHAQIQPPTPQPTPQTKPNKKERPQREDVEWLWQYTPDATNKEGRENDLVQDLRFKPFLDQFLDTPQTFWGIAINGRYRSLANTALDHLTVPGKVLADENRYISITGCVVHFCPARGLLWVDLNGKQQHLVVFAAIDWIKEDRPASDPAAQYTLWVFPNMPLTAAAGGSSGPAQRIPPALTKSIARWTAEPLPGPGTVQNITHAILVDPDGTPHEVPPAALGVQPPQAPHTDTAPNPDSNSDAPTLKPRN
jgi:hypothetical protein